MDGCKNVLLTILTVIIINNFNSGCDMHGGSIKKAITEMQSHYEMFLCNQKLSKDEREILQLLG